MTKTQRPRSQPLGAAELAEAAVLADLGLVLCLLSWFLPIAALAMPAQALAAVPFAVVVWRRRMRAAVAATVSAAVLAFLVGGPFLVVNVGGSAVLGALVGGQLRRRRRYLAAVGWSAAGASVVAVAVTLPVLAALPELRRLTLVQLETGWKAVASGLRGLGLSGVAETGDGVVRWGVENWWASLSLVQVALVTALSAVAVAAGRLTVRRLADAVPGPEVAPDHRDGGGEPDPLPVRLDGVSHWYGGADRPALVDVSVDVPAGALIAVVGGNGSGKSTLARVIAGMPPSAGAVDRPGGVGLGRPGGTAMIFQRPESQVLASRVREDVLWGLPAATDLAVEVDDLLEDVGLRGFADRETATLSGGELQRLAIAAALARRPRLLVSDESTAMLDTAGRAQVVALLRRLVDGRGMTVVHVTHDPSEALAADLVVEMDGGRLASVTAGRDWSPPPAPALPTMTPGRPATATPGGPALQLSGVGHVYSQGSPWEHRALEGIDVGVAPGEGVLVVGGNGSGKSTLAWVLTGLIDPTGGTASLGGQPVRACPGQVALSFQHARLQLLRPTVEEDVRAAGGPEGLDPARALELVGLDPRTFARRRVDALSGGEQRLVALAGLLARRPRVLVLDEPFAGLDASARSSLVATLARLRADEGLALVLVSHDLELASAVVDRVLTLSGGRIVSQRRLDQARQRCGAA